MARTTRNNKSKPSDKIENMDGSESASTTDNTSNRSRSRSPGFATNNANQARSNPATDHQTSANQSETATARSQQVQHGIAQDQLIDLDELPSAEPPAQQPSCSTVAKVTNQVINATNNMVTSNAASTSLEKLNTAVTTVQQGLGIMEKIIDRFTAVNDQMPLNVQHQGLLALINSPACISYNKTLETLTETIKTLSTTAILTKETATGQFSQAASAKANGDGSQAPPIPHLFEVRLTPIKDMVPPDTKVIKVFLEATEGTKINVHEYEDRNGKGHFKVTSQLHAINAKKALLKHKYNGTEVKQMYNTSYSIISSLSIKTIKMTRDNVRSHIAWIDKDDNINMEMAKRILINRNADWCKTEEDVLHIQLNSLPKGMVAIQIFVQPDAYDRLLLYVRNSFRIDVGGGVTVQAFYDLSPTYCFRCSDYGHTYRACRGEVRCKYCAGAHESGGCPPDTEPNCIHCNEKNAKEQTNLPTNHPALQSKCPVYVTRRDELTAQRRAEAYARQNGGN